MCYVIYNSSPSRRPTKCEHIKVVVYDSLSACLISEKNMTTLPLLTMFYKIVIFCRFEVFTAVTEK
jgi:hypothetical protein